MNLDELYQKILSEIEQGHRGLVRLTNTELNELNSVFGNSMEDSGKLEKILCIVEHSATLSQIFESNIIRVLNSKLPDTHLIFALNCSRKHIIEARFTRGQRLEYEFLETLKKLLYHSIQKLLSGLSEQSRAPVTKGYIF